MHGYPDPVNLCPAALGAGRISASGAQRRQRSTRRLDEHSTGHCGCGI